MSGAVRCVGRRSPERSGDVWMGVGPVLAVPLWPKIETKMRESEVPHGETQCRQASHVASAAWESASPFIPCAKPAQTRTFVTGILRTWWPTRPGGRWSAPHHRAQQAPARHAGVAALTQSLMPPDASRAELVQAAQVLKSWFGPNGGQSIRYSKELAARLVLAKSITSAELARWRQHGRLPDRINVADPGKSPAVEWQDAATTRQAWLLAGIGANPLAMEAAARRLGVR